MKIIDKKIGILITILCVGILGVAGFSIFVVETERSQYRDNSEIIDFATNNSKSKILVLSHSRSKNTELMAQEIAKYYNGHHISIKSEEYEIGYKGWVNALKDARGKFAKIHPAKLDMNKYDMIFLGSPIWLYSPTPPIWQFVANNNFQEKKVILFNTFNSYFDQKLIDELGGLITKNNGIFEGHIYIKRERMTNQISTEKLIKDTKKILSSLDLI